MAQQVLSQFQEHPEAWQRVPAILQQASNTQSKVSSALRRDFAYLEGAEEGNALQKRGERARCPHAGSLRYKKVAEKGKAEWREPLKLVMQIGASAITWRFEA